MKFEIGNRVSINEYHNKEGKLIQPDVGIIVSMDENNPEQIHLVYLDSGAKWARPEMKLVKNLTEVSV